MKQTRIKKPSLQTKSPKNLNVDVRSKIIKKTRSKIVDAREKIIAFRQGSIVDARLKLLETKSSKPKSRLTRKNINIQRSSKTKPNWDVVDLTLPDIHRTVQGFKTNGSARRSNEFDDLMSSDYRYHAGSLKRTIKNDMAYGGQSMFDLSPPANYDDPFDCYVVPTRRPVLPETRKRPTINSYASPRNMSAHMDSYSGPEHGILK